MGLIQEIVKHPKIKGVELVIDKKSKDETCEDWEIVTVDIGWSAIRTPNDMIEVGKWLIANANLIKQYYDAKGNRVR